MHIPKDHVFLYKVPMFACAVNLLAFGTREDEQSKHSPAEKNSKASHSQSISREHWDQYLKDAKLENCRLARSADEVQIDQLVFFTPDAIAIERPLSKSPMAIHDPSTHLVWRSLASRYEDGSCQEMSGMVMACRQETTSEYIERLLHPTQANSPCSKNAPHELCLFDASKRCAPQVSVDAGTSYLSTGASLTSVQSFLSHQEGGPWKVMTVGLGAGCQPTALYSYPEVIQDVVEINPSIVAAARSAMAIPEGPRLRIHTADALEWVRSLPPDQQFDVVSVTSSPSHPSANTLFSSDFFRYVKSHIRPGGRLSYGAAREARNIVKNMLWAAGFAEAAEKGERIVGFVDAEGSSAFYKNIVRTGSQPFFFDIDSVSSDWLKHVAPKKRSTDVDLQLGGDGPSTY